MALKAAILALVLVAAWVILRRPGRGKTRPAARRNRQAGREPQPQDLVACPLCGVFRLPGAPCDCDRRPTSDD